MGLPGAGKSTIRDTRFSHMNAVVIDPDYEKLQIPGYDPKKPWIVHEESKRLATLKMYDAIGENKPIIIDGTGTNAEKMVHQVKELQRFGYNIELVYVRVKLNTAIERNSNRERVVPEEIIREKHQLISVSFEIVASYVDKVTVIDND